MLSLAKRSLNKHYIIPKTVIPVIRLEYEFIGILLLIKYRFYYKNAPNGLIIAKYGRFIRLRRTSPTTYISLFILE